MLYWKSYPAPLLQLVPGAARMDWFQTTSNTCSMEYAETSHYPENGLVSDYFQHVFYAICGDISLSVSLIMFLLEFLVQREWIGFRLLPTRVLCNMRRHLTIREFDHVSVRVPGAARMDWFQTTSNTCSMEYAETSHYPENGLVSDYFQHVFYGICGDISLSVSLIMFLLEFLVQREWIGFRLLPTRVLCNMRRHLTIREFDHVSVRVPGAARMDWFQTTSNTCSMEYAETSHYP
ncbi:hypothetical protein J6590_049854 [Homalodisca vitripennis]|nr:hypothetical protein J6590_049854 [Homalodisca vitripennis]